MQAIRRQTESKQSQNRRIDLKRGRKFRETKKTAGPFSLLNQLNLSEDKIFPESKPLDRILLHHKA